MGTKLTIADKTGADSSDIIAFDKHLLEILEMQGLPSEKILVPIDTRMRILKNVPDAIEKLPIKQREKSTYLSKCFAAVACGLIDAALNYLWDETVSELRKRIIANDLRYFLDQATCSRDKKKKIIENQDLSILSDADLIRDSHTVGLITDAGYQKLQLVSWMRNHASAAHPNQNEISATDLVSYIDVCITEVITAPINETTLSHQRLIINVRTKTVDDFSEERFRSAFAEQPREKLEVLARTLFSIYTDPKEPNHVRTNAQKVFKEAWSYISEEQKRNFGTRTSEHLIHLESEEGKLAEKLLLSVNGGQYLPRGERAIKISELLSTLTDAHRGWDNFHHEPPIVKQLANYVGNEPVPEQVQFKYVEVLLEVLVGNVYGVSNDAEPTYLKLLGNFDSWQADYATYILTGDKFSWLCQHASPKRQITKVLNFIKQLEISDTTASLLDLALSSGIPLDKLHLDKRIKRQRELLEDGF